MQRIAILLLILIAFYPAIGNAQSTKIEGRVTNAETGEALTGVTISLKNGNKGCFTNQHGYFVLTVASTSEITFSYVGMQSITLRTPSNGKLDVAMHPLANTIDEVVISAYGSITRAASSSSAYSTVKSEAVRESPNVNFDLSLKGQMAGVHVSTASGLIADGTSIRVRGASSVNLSSQPLFVVDGVPLSEATNLNIFNYGSGVRFDPLATINSNDIESVEVLKDASAAALYGSRAGNGVILITTKKGKYGRVSISYNGSMALSEASKLPHLLNAKDFVTITNEKASAWFGAGTTLATEYVVDGKPVETNWMKEAFRTAQQQNHQISLSGGSAKATFYASADWLQQDGVVVGTDLSRYSFRTNADAQPNKWLKVGISLSYSKSVYDGTLSEGYNPGITVAAYNAPPNTASIIDGAYNINSDGVLGAGGNLYTYKGQKTYLNPFNHPLAVNTMHRNRNTAERNLSSGYIQLLPIKGLRLTSKLGIDELSNLEDQLNHPDLSGVGKNYNGFVQVNNALMQQWSWSNYANYDLALEKHLLNFTAGVEYTHRITQDIYSGASNLVSSYYQDILDNLFTTSYAGGDKAERGFASYFSKVSYNYQDRFFVDASFRSDALSDFGKDNQYGYFPGLSAAWRISNENFMKAIPVFNDLKVRASWGLVGNSNIPAYSNRTIYGQGQYGDINGMSMRQVGNDALKWESNQKVNFGVDAVILNKGISVSIDLFKNTVSNMLLFTPAVLSSGIPGGRINSNIGKMWNRGFEVQLSTRNIDKGEFKWTSFFNYTFIKNKIETLAGSDILGTNSLVVGQPMGVWRLYRWAGVDSQTGRAGYYDKNGKVKYYDPNPAIAAASKWTYADGSIAPALNDNDMQILSGKTGTPKWYGNFDNTFSYKQLELNIGLQFAGGNYILNNTKSNLLTNYLNNNVSDILNRWTQPGQNTDIPKLYWSDKVSLQSTSTRFLECGDFLRLRDITLTYTLPSTLTSKLGFEGRIYLRGDNLAILTGYSGLDPEISTYRNSNYQMGWENRSVPFTRSYSLGVMLKF